jgi:hypothetical protein
LAKAEDNNKMHLKTTGYKAVNWMHIDEGRNLQMASVNTKIKLQIP